ncbi:MAG: hypothetical protein Q9M16_03800 [Mariprofundus sp.]|nr:hypothetical protein [Mariprofundus sp.]
MTEKEKQYFEVMLEQILHEVKTVAEGHCVLDEKLERLHKESKEDHRLAMDLIKYSHDELKAEIQGVRTELKEEIQGVEKKMISEIRAVGGQGESSQRERVPWGRRWKVMSVKGFDPFAGKRH